MRNFLETRETEDSRVSYLVPREGGNDYNSSRIFDGPATRIIAKSCNEDR